jgi:hypothetical protein
MAAFTARLRALSRSARKTAGLRVARASDHFRITVTADEFRAGLGSCFCEAANTSIPRLGLGLFSSGVVIAGEVHSSVSKPLDSNPAHAISKAPPVST